MRKRPEPGTSPLSAIVDRYLRWREIYAHDPDAAGPDAEAGDRLADAVLETETWLLRQRPANMIEAICLLDVAAENLADGGRWDRADYGALAAVQQYLATLIAPEQAGADGGLLAGVRLARAAATPMAAHD